ncbi:MAG: sterol desaturase family protein [Synechococcales bacterium]|nr:sterol desaturase family protein [Synechococcales bacterium]
MSPKLIVILTSLLFFGMLEQLHPFFQIKAPLLHRMGGNFGLGLINTIATQLTVVGGLTWIWQHPLQLQLPFSPPLLPVSFLLQGIIAFCVLDAYLYLWHRAMHTFGWGWRLHQWHHSDRRMNVSTAYRFHTAEVLLSNVPKLSLIALLGISPEALMLYECCFAASLIFHHSNWALPRGCDRVLSYLIVTPNLHRLHHSQLRSHQQYNFSSLLTVWDRWFGTWQYPVDPRQIQLGLGRSSGSLQSGTRSSFG